MSHILSPRLRDESAYLGCKRLCSPSKMRNVVRNCYGCVLLDSGHDGHFVLGLYGRRLVTGLAA